MAENNDFLPPEGFGSPTTTAQLMQGWYYHLPRTLGVRPILTCPGEPIPPSTRPLPLDLPGNPRRSSGYNLFHYCLNEHHDGTGENDRPARLCSIPRPAAVVWLFDSKNIPGVGTANFVHTNLHSGGAQFTFLDGHARRFRNVEYWDFHANKGRTNNPELVWAP